MARKKKNKEEKVILKAPEPSKYHKGDIVLVPYADLPGTVLGKVYKYDGADMRLVFIADPSKLIVE